VAVCSRFGDSGGLSTLQQPAPLAALVRQAQSRAGREYLEYAPRPPRRWICRQLIANLLDFDHRHAFTVNPDRARPAVQKSAPDVHLGGRHLNDRHFILRA
jgi:hypothetical protein